MKLDWDTQEQCDMFDEYISDTPDGRQVSLSGARGYDEVEWEAFQHGWNAAKKHFGIEERDIPNLSAEERETLSATNWGEL